MPLVLLWSGSLSLDAKQIITFKSPKDLKSAYWAVVADQ